MARQMRLYGQIWTLGTIQTAGGPASSRKISQLVIRKRWNEGTPRLSSRSFQRQSFTSACTCITSFHRCSCTLLSGLSYNQGLLFTLSWVLWECGGTKSLLLFLCPILEATPWIPHLVFSVGPSLRAEAGKNTKQRFWVITADCFVGKTAVLLCRSQPS